MCKNFLGVLFFISSLAGAETVHQVFTVGEQAEASVEFVRLSDGKVLFSHQATKALIPASIAKLVLSAALLETLSPSFQMETRFFYTGDREKGVVSGDLIIVGDGDPFLVSEELFLIAADWKAKGIREFRGNLVIDNSLFDGQAWDRERIQGRDQTEHAFHAPVTAFGVNFNTVAVNVAPGEKVGSPALVNFDPVPLQELSLENHALTSSYAEIDVNVRRVTANGRTQLIVEGTIPQGFPLQKFYRAVNDPIQVSGGYVRSFLNTVGISVRGTVKEGRLPRTAHHFYTHKSKPLSDLVKSLNLYSSNYMADVLLKRLAVHCCGQGSFAAGAKFLEGYLRGKGVEGDFTLTNGSGLDEGSALSARQLTTLLVKVGRDYRIFPEFLASLPVAGESGTLEHRFGASGTQTHGLLRAKTGTLSSPVSVSNLSGYLHHAQHGLVAFAVIQNGKKRQQPSVLALRESQEKALMSLLKSL